MTPPTPAASPIDVRHEARLSDYTTFQLGGPCRRLVTCESSGQLQHVLAEQAREGRPYVLLGGGSNVLVSDLGFDGTVVRYVTTQPDIRREGLTVRVDAGASLDALVRFCTEHALDGLMCCSGIPGTVGGALVGNAGAWGRQIADSLESVTLMDRTGKEREVDAATLGFAYRRSLLQTSPDIVVSVSFRLDPGDRARLEGEYRRILQQRAERHPDLRTDPCIGSFFRNIEPTSAAGRRQAAGWFLEQAGAKPMRVGGARVFERHANIIVKGEGCTAQDVHDLARRMAEAVRQRFGLALVREVRFLGSFAGEPSPPPPGFY